MGKTKRDTFLPGKGKIGKKLLSCPKNIYSALCGADTGKDGP